MLQTFADENLSGPVVRGLLQWGMDVVTPLMRGLTGRDDIELLPIAAGEGRVMLTNDRDFLGIHAAWMDEGRSHAGIVYWHARKYSIGDCIHQIVGFAARTRREDAKDTLFYL